MSLQPNRPRKENNWIYNLPLKNLKKGIHYWSNGHWKDNKEIIQTIQHTSVQLLRRNGPVHLKIQTIKTHAKRGR